MREIVDEQQLREVVAVEELFLHCAKAFRRSSLWDTSAWPDRRPVPSAGRMVKGQFGTRAPASLIDAALRVEARRNTLTRTAHHNPRGLEVAHSNG